MNHMQASFPHQGSASDARELRERYLEEAPEGRILLRHMCALVTTLLSDWKESGRSLLEISCGSGLLTQHIVERRIREHRTGHPRTPRLDIALAESNPRLRSRLSRRLPCMEPPVATFPDALPWQDDAFDYALLHVDETVRELGLAACMEEALRVASRGACVVFWNASAPLASHLDAASPAFPMVDWIAVRSCLARYGCQTKGVSALPLPPGAFSWLKPLLPAAFENALQAPRGWTLGIVGGIRIDLAPKRPLTRRPLLVRPKLAKNLCAEGLASEALSQMGKEIPCQMGEEGR